MPAAAVRTTAKHAIDVSWPMTSDDFAGFPADTFAFLADLTANNSTPWFHANKARYQEVAARPFAQLVDVLIDVLPDALDPRIRGESKVGGSLFRINRDIRFSADKSPYKDHLDAIFWLAGPEAASAGARRHSPSLFLRITADQLVLGAGVYGLKGDELRRYREAVAGPPGAEAAKLVAAALAKGATISDASRVKPPKPYSADHPHADLLRHDGFFVVADHDLPAEVSSRKLVSWVTKKWKPLAPVASWFADQLA